jgi:O-antigen ligase
MTTLAADGLRVAQGRSARAYVSAWPAIRPVLVFRSALLLLVIGNLGRVPIGSAGAKDAPLLFNDLLVLAVLAAGLLAGIRARTWRIDAPALLAIVFGAVGAVSAILGASRFGLTGIQLVFSLAYLARWLAYFGIYLVAINTLRAADVPSIWRALESTILAFAAFGILQSIFLPGFAQLIYPDMGWDEQGRRLVSTLLDPNFAGGLVMIGLLVELARMAAGAEVPPWKPAVLAIALLLTLSRSSVLAFVVGCLLILAVRGPSRRVLRLAGGFVVLSLPFAPLLLGFARNYNKLIFDASALGRLESWLRGVTVFADNPVLGVGFNTYGFVQRAYGWDFGGMARFGLDGGLLFIAVMTGLVGLALYLGVVGTVLARCRRIWRDRARSAEDRGLAIGVAAATVATLAHSVFVNSLLFPFIMEVLWVLWALTFVLRAPEREGGTAPPGPVVASFGFAFRAPLR